MPDCDAWIVQVPAVTNVTVDPLTVQVAVVIEAKLTTKPEDAAALTVNGALPSCLSIRGANVIVCAALATAKLWLTLGAAA